MQQFKLELKNLRSIKFVLIILIVCIHASPFISDIINSNTAFQIYLSQIIGRIAVPLYFFISGYLLSLGFIEYSDWKRKIKSRISSILIPYFIWNSLYGLALIILTRKFGIPTSFLGVDGEADILFKIYLSPAISPLWFLRDLFLFQLCSICILFFSKWFKVILAIVFTVFWLYDFHFFNSTISTEGALFFFLGFLHLLPAYSFFKKNKNFLIITALILSVVDLFIKYRGFWFSFFFHRITILSLCYSFVYIFFSSSYFNFKLSKLKSISKYSFYIFVLHFPLLYVADHFLNSVNVIEYFLKIILILLISIVIGYTINRFPKLSDLLTGNRS